jgi:hypothetical protein
MESETISYNYFTYELLEKNIIVLNNYYIPRSIIYKSFKCDRCSTEIISNYIN